MLLSREAAMRFRKDFEYVEGMTTWTHNKGDYKISSLIIVPLELVNKGTISENELEEIASEGVLYNPKYKKFYVMSIRIFEDEDSRRWANENQDKSGWPEKGLLDEELRKLNIKFKVEDYLENGGRTK